MVNYIEYLIFKFFYFIVSFVPWSSIQKIGTILGNILFFILKNRRLVAIENLSFAFPTKSEKEIISIAKKSFQSISISFLEILNFRKLSIEKLKSLIDVDNIDDFQSFFRGNQSGIILSSHYGNWELLASALNILSGKNVLIVVQKQRNKFIDEFLNKNRKRFGCDTTYLDSAPKEVIKSLQNYEAVGMIADQSAKKEELQIDFFGRTAPTHRGPAIFSLRCNSQIIFTILKRLDNGKYKLIYEKINQDDLSGSNDDKIFQLTTKHVKILEKYLILDPSQWLWGHKRWKHSK